MGLPWITSFLLVVSLASNQQQNAPDAEAERLIQQLHSDSITVRLEAYQALKALGPNSIPVLKKAAQSSDPDFALAARRALRAIEVQPKLTKNLLKALPDIDDRLAAGTPEDWTKVFLEIRANWWSKRYCRMLTREDVDVLIAQALRGAAPDERARIAQYAGLWKPPAFRDEVGVVQRVNRNA